jgi:elongation factor G
MSIEVSCPEENIGAIMGDLNRRRCVPQGMQPRPSHHVIKAEGPLAELFGYAANIRTLSSGRATASLTFSHYASVPDAAAKKILEKRR